MKTLVIATRNAHKFGEIRALLGDGFRLCSLNDFPEAPSAVEDADTFAGNAVKKAGTIARWLQRTVAQDRRTGRWFVLADDSGLEVDALNGAPGVHSARFAAIHPTARGNSSDGANNAKLLALLRDLPLAKRTARFRCVLALVELPPSPSMPSPLLFEGACEGCIQFEPKGAGGFGYDPLFVPRGLAQSFAELGEDVKNKLSHRAKAFEKLKAFLSDLEPASPEASEANREITSGGLPTQ
jgi:XTP/dITP diphosphohydrolase